MATVLSASTIDIEWTPPHPSDRNGIIIGYHILVQNQNIMYTQSFNVTGDTYSVKAEGMCVSICVSTKCTEFFI